MGSLEDFTTEALEKELARREEEKMMPTFIKFKWYLHNSYTRPEIQEVFEEKTGFAINEELATIIQNKFYEFEVECDLDVLNKRVYISRPR